MTALFLCCSVLLAVCTVSSAYPYDYPVYAFDQEGAESSFAPAVLAAPAAADLDTAATHHGHYGRVQIKVYRGPSHHHDHAPHGFWVKQPADEHHHH